MLRLRNGLLVTAISAALSFIATDAHALALYQDTHDGTAPRSAFGTGASIDCATAEAGCSLKLDPAGPAFTGVRADMNTFLGHTVVRFAFKNEAGSQDVDADVVVRLEGGAVIKLHLTGGWGSSNNALWLITPTGEVAAFDTSPNTWSSYYIDIDSDTGFVTAGRVGGVPARLPLGAYTQLQSVEFVAVRWGGGSALHYDNTVVVQA